MAAGDRFHVLDAMRGAAALAVVAFHLDVWFPASPAPMAFMAVDLFFALSGFVIAHSYGRRLAEGLSFGGFLRLRLIRLYPLYLAGMLLGALFQLTLTISQAEHALSPAELVRSFLFGLVFAPSPDGAAGELFPLNLPAWSLLFELGANLLYAVLHRRLTTVRLAALVSVSAVVLAATVVARGASGGGEAWDELVPGLARVSFSFFAGVLLYRLYPVLERRTPRLPALLLLAGLAALLTAPVYAAAAKAVLFMVFALALSPALVLLGASARPPRLGGFLLRQLGLASYPLYAVHYPLIQIAQPLALLVAPPLAAALFLTGATVAARLLVDVYDAPVRAWLAGRRAGPRSGRPPPSPRRPCTRGASPRSPLAAGSAAR